MTYVLQPGEYIDPASITDKNDPKFATVHNRTKQSFKDECDINKIMQRVLKTGIDPFADRVASGKYVDLTQMPDFRTAMDTIVSAKNFFDSLPSQVRARFDHDPALLADFLANPANADEARKLGLLPVIKQESDASASAQSQATTSPDNVSPAEGGDKSGVTA